MSSLFFKNYPTDLNKMDMPVNNTNKNKSLRLKSVREKLGFSQEEMAKLMNLELGSYRNKEYGKDKLTDKNLSLLHERLNVMTDFIVYGTGEMFEGGKNPIEQQNEIDLLNELLLLKAKVEMLSSFATEIKSQINSIVNQITIKLKE